jgi:hypothetical protein
MYTLSCIKTDFEKESNIHASLRYESFFAGQVLKAITMQRCCSPKFAFKFKRCKPDAATSVPFSGLDQRQQQQQDDDDDDDDDGDDLLQQQAEESEGIGMCLQHVPAGRASARVQGEILGSSSGPPLRTLRLLSTSQCVKKEGCGPGEPEEQDGLQKEVQEEDVNR